MLKASILKRSASTSTYKGASQISIPRRPLKKIHLGKARPAIYHQFDVQVELSDGSVITRKSQFPKDQIRLIQDQRNNALWNQSRDDLVVVDAGAGGSLGRFKKRYSSLFSIEEDPKVSEMKKGAEVESKTAAAENEVQPTSEDAPFEMDDYLSLLSDNSKQISTGKLATKKKLKK